MGSTAASDNLTLLPSDPIETKHNPHDPTDVPMDVDGLEDEEYQGLSSPKVQHRKLESVPRALTMDDEHFEEESERPHNEVKQPNGVTIIEKLDTPATRREKNLRRKAEKQKMVIQAGEAAISAGSSSNLSAIQQLSQPPLSSAASQVHRPFGLRLGDDVESELSELSDLASLASEVPDKAEKTTTAGEELKDEDEMNERHPEIDMEGEEPTINASSSRPEQSLTMKDKAQPQDPRRGKFPGGTLGKFLCYK
jgi:hypothetical protein